MTQRTAPRALVTTKYLQWEHTLALLSLRPAWPRLPALQAVPTKFCFAASSAFAGAPSVGGNSGMGVGGTGTGSVRVTAGGGISGGFAGASTAMTMTTPGVLGAQLAIAAWLRAALDGAAGVARLRYAWRARGGMHMWSV